MRKNPVPRYRIALVKETVLEVEHPHKVTTHQKAAGIFREVLKDADREHIIVATVDNRNTLIGVNVVHVGSLNTALISTRDVIKLAVLQNAGGLILGHNHPSGDPVPSKEDHRGYERVKEACRIMDIKLLDSIILGDETYFSMHDNVVRRYASINTYV
jgi:DNA repair protein RadC